MGRKSQKRPWNQPHRPLDLDRLASLPRTEAGPGGNSYTVRNISAGAKDYTCPGCLQPVRAGQGHVVAWRNDGFFGAEADLADRRHWHKSCWQRRLRPQ